MNDIVQIGRDAINDLAVGGRYHKKVLDSIGDRDETEVRSIIRFTQNLFNIALKNTSQHKALQEAPHTFVDAAIRFYTLGLSTDPSDGEGYVVVFYNKATRCNEATVWIGYKAIAKYLQKTGKYGLPNIILIYSNDEFSYTPSNLDNPVKHESNICTRTKQDKIVGCWMRMKEIATGDYFYHVTSLERIERAKAIGGPAWGTDEASMAKKTCLLDASQFITITDGEKEKDLFQQMQSEREMISEAVVVNEPPKLSGGKEKFGNKRTYEPIDDEELNADFQKALEEQGNG